VLLVDDRESQEAPYEVLAPATALGIYEGGLVPVAAGSVLHRIRAERIVVATGALEQPLLFSGNDLVGVMLPEGVRRMVDEWAVKPGESAVLVGEGAMGVRGHVARAGVEVAAASLRPERLAAHGRRGRLRSVELDGERIDCDLLVVSGGLQPAYSLLAQA